MPSFQTLNAKISGASTSSGRGTRHLCNLSAQAATKAFVRSIAVGCLVFAGIQPSLAAAATGDLKIEQPALGSTIELQTSARFAGAVTSLVFRGKQFVDSRDHGRELQSAA
jgi:hypothetical protein